MPEKWDDEEESTPPSSPPAGAVKALPRRGKFDDEESEDSDVLESWDAAEDSEVEREKVRVAAEKKAKADADAAAAKKSKSQRIAERIAAKKLLAEEYSSDEEDEDESARRERLRRTEQEADLKHAEDLFGDIGVPNTRVKTTAANAVQVDASDPSIVVDFAKLPVFKPKTKLQFEKLRDTLVPLFLANASQPHYHLFLQDFCKQIAKDMKSNDIKSVASALTALSNEKLKEEKAAEKGGKKSKAAKTKVALNASRNVSSMADTNTYDDDFGDDDFM